MHPALLLAIYCAISVVASLSGGWILLAVHLTHRRMQIAISFVSGVMLGIGLLHMLPHSFEMLGSIDSTVFWVLVGFLFMFFLERFFHFHHHDAPDDENVASKPRLAAHHDHDHAHDHEHAHDHAQLASAFPSSGAIVGLTLHGIIDGVAMAAAVQADDANGAIAWAGFGAALAVLLHKPFDSLTIGTLLAAAGRTKAMRHALNGLYSLVTPLGVLLFYATSATFDGSSHGLGQVLGFAAGAFICIASSDLLPELQFHRHDRAALSAALLLGIAIAWSTIFLEESGHAHSHAPSHEAEHDHLHERAHP